MDIKEKVAEALRRYIKPDHVRLEDDGGVYGYVVSPRFQGMTALDRQKLVDKALRTSSVKLTRPELRQVLAIAALTPAEFESLPQSANHP